MRNGKLKPEYLPKLENVNDSCPTWKQIASTNKIWWDIVGLFTPRRNPRPASEIQ
jgi:hypothetical protein